MNLLFEQKCEWPLMTSKIFSMFMMKRLFKKLAYFDRISNFMALNDSWWPQHYISIILSSSFQFWREFIFWKSCLYCDAWSIISKYFYYTVFSEAFTSNQNLSSPKNRTVRRKKRIDHSRRRKNSILSEGLKFCYFYKLIKSPLLARLVISGSRA